MAQDQIGSNGIANNAITTGKIDTGAVTTTDIASSAITSAKFGADAVPSGRKNLVINGDMRIHQRTGTTTRGAGVAATPVLDRWVMSVNSTTGVADISQSTDVPSGEGFGHSLKIDVTTVNSPSNVNYAILRQVWERSDLHHLNRGTSSAKQLTLSFWVKSSFTGNVDGSLFYVELQYPSVQAGATVENSKSFTINAANTWEKKTITYEANTTDTPNTNNYNSLDMYVYFWLMAGSNFGNNPASQPTHDSGWGNNTNRVPGQANFFSGTSNEMYITGVQLEVGDAATDFEFRPFEQELRSCQRYYQKSQPYEYAVPPVSSYGEVMCQRFNNTDRYFALGNRFPVEMRNTPTVTIFDRNGNSGSMNRYNNSNQVQVDSINGGSQTDLFRYIDQNSIGGHTNDDFVHAFNYTANCET